MPSGRPEDSATARHFTYDKKNDKNEIEKGKFVATCKLCGDYKAAKNVTRERAHLENDCTGYKFFLATEGIQKRQQRLDTMVQHQQSKKHLADQRFALAAYASNRPFGVYDTPEFKTAFAVFDYIPPTRDALAGDLLDSTFEYMEEEVKKMVRKWRHQGVGLVNDESSNVTNTRIHNVCVTLADPDRTILLWNTADIGEEIYSADVIVEYVTKHGNSITDGQPQMIKCFSSDTADKMISVGEKLRQMPGWSHVEWVPCDSHGLNLLIQDICNLPSCADTLKSVTNWITHFKKASKQFAILRKCQKKEYGGYKALVKAVITRWGTQVNKAIYIALTIFTNFILAWCIAEHHEYTRGTAYVLNPRGIHGRQRAGSSATPQRRILGEDRGSYRHP